MVSFCMTVSRPVSIGLTVCFNHKADLPVCLCFDLHDSLYPSLSFIVPFYLIPTSSQHLMPLTVRLSFCVSVCLSVCLFVCVEVLDRDPSDLHVQGHESIYFIVF